MTQSAISGLWIFCIWTSIGMVSGRNDARGDICARIPWFSACSGNGQRQNSGSPSAPTQADLPQPGTTNKDAFCKQYQAHYTYFCSDQGPGSGQAPSFCNSYSHNCNTNAAPDASAPNPFGNSQMSQREINAKCQEYKAMASSYCNGQEPPSVKPYCDAYRKYCTNSDKSGSSASSSDADLSQKIDYCTRYQTAYNGYCSGHRPTGRVATFCYAYKDYCSSLPQVDSGSAPSRDVGSSVSRQPSFPNYNNSAQVRQLCDQYKWMSDRSCPGFEVQDLREYCNMYRVYCQGKDPVPSIDGSFGWNKDQWGVAGIPYYPFNPQGAIGGGERHNVGFGDWGANYQQRKGVTDFWDQTKQVDANWQKGNYGYSQGWNVPLLGIGGYKNNDIHLGGIANPSDFPSVMSGGVLPAMAGANGGLPSFGGPSFDGGMPTVSGGLGGPLAGLGGLGNLFG